MRGVPGIKEDKSEGGSIFTPSEARQLSLQGGDLYASDSIGGGDCFFDSFRQSLEQQKGVQVTVEELRKVCKDFSLLKPVPEWFDRGIKDKLKTKDSEEKFKDSREYANQIESSSVWGDPRIEGKILCERYSVKLYVVETNVRWQKTDGKGNFLAEKGEELHFREVINPDGSTGDVGVINCYENAVCITNGGDGHFEPLLQKAASEVMLSTSQTNRQRQIQRPPLTHSERGTVEDYHLVSFRKGEIFGAGSTNKYIPRTNSCSSMDNTKVGGQHRPRSGSDSSLSTRPPSSKMEEISSTRGDASGERGITPDANSSSLVRF